MSQMSKCDTNSQKDIFRCHCLFKFHFVFRYFSWIIGFKILRGDCFWWMPNIIRIHFQRCMWPRMILRYSILHFDIARPLKTHVHYTIKLTKIYTFPFIFHFFSFLFHFFSNNMQYNIPKFIKFLYIEFNIIIFSIKVINEYNKYYRLYTYNTYNTINNTID